MGAKLLKWRISTNRKETKTPNTKIVNSRLYCCWTDSLIFQRRKISRKICDGKPAEAKIFTWSRAKGVKWCFLVNKFTSISGFCFHFLFFCWLFVVVGPLKKQKRLNWNIYDYGAHKLLLHHSIRLRVYWSAEKKYCTFLDLYLARAIYGCINIYKY